MSCAQAVADVTINLRSKQTAPATQPAKNDPSVSLSAVLDHPFASTVKIDGRSVDVSGNVRELSKSQYRLKIKYAIRNSDATRAIDSEVDIKAGEEIELSGLKSGNSRSVIVLTIMPQ